MLYTFPQKYTNRHCFSCVTPPSSLLSGHPEVGVEAVVELGQKLSVTQRNQVRGGGGEG